MKYDWVKIRSLVDPYSILNHTENDAYLYVSSKEAAPFGKEEKEVGRWISSDLDSLFLFFKEITLREMLFEDYVNGDAVPELQPFNFFDLLSLLLKGARNGELDSWHDGLVTLEEIEDWANHQDNKNHYEKLENILRRHDLNLHVEFYPNKETAIKRGAKTKHSLI